MISSSETQQVIVTLPIAFVEKVEEVAKKNGLSRSAFLRMMLLNAEFPNLPPSNRKASNERTS